MILGRVIGQVWGTRRSAQLGPEKLLLVAQMGEPEAGGKRQPTGTIVVAMDNIGAGYGELVTVAWGSGARAVIKTPPNRHILADAAVARIVDGTSASPAIEQIPQKDTDNVHG